MSVTLRGAIEGLGTFGTAIKAFCNALLAYFGDGLLAIGTLVISAADAATFKTTTTAYFRIAGVQYSKAAADEIAFTDADTVNVGADTGSFWGVWLVQIDAAGVVTTKSPSADQVYTTEALAIAALPEVDAGSVALGYITVNANDDAAWTANTDDLTPESDVLDAVFYDADVIALPDAITESAPGALLESTARDTRRGE